MLQLSRSDTNVLQLYSLYITLRPCSVGNSSLCAYLILL